MNPPAFLWRRRVRVFRLERKGYYCPAIGLVRLTVGQKRNDGAKVQYCITALKIEKDAVKASL
mgnify:CR=1 FL=1